MLNATTLRMHDPTIPNWKSLGTDRRQHLDAPLDGLYRSLAASSTKHSE